MKHLIGRRDVLAAGLGLCTSLGAGAALAQSSTPPREAGTDDLGRRIGGPAPRRREGVTLRRLSNAGQVGCHPARIRLTDQPGFESGPPPIEASSNGVISWK